MIATLRGTVLKKHLQSVIVEVGKVGYSVFVTTTTARKLSHAKDVFLHCYQYVREDSLELYGFLSEREKQLFTELITVSGIGPKSALSILEVAGVEDIESAVVAGDPKILTSVSGIGEKLAGRIILELKNKFAKRSGASGVVGEDAEVVEGLLGLGYARGAAREAVKGIPRNVRGTSERLREALRRMGR